MMLLEDQRRMGVVFAYFDGIGVAAGAYSGNGVPPRTSLAGFDRLRR
jgi:hypothetical protein